ncbi:hypothetical protein FKG96_22315 [Olivibacter sp. LS-1]|uniref:hypothetical protein n=1 Tax=Olivibacter sp. LS-1 TaxID=2592345 RepID=UPI0011EAA9CF|nr:hypothetical protein [Olivibacter sp. LS-1]QEL03447.1 hypothetical protein FKG96_22315 [Olivibacter sp. LS-1]
MKHRIKKNINWPMKNKSNSKTVIEEMKKYTCRGSFRFAIEDNISHVCDAPAKHGGIYIIHAYSNNKPRLVYIGSSGKKIVATGLFKERKDGIWGRIVRGTQRIAGSKSKERRCKFWVKEMDNGGVDFLEFDWFVLHDKKAFFDCPETVEKSLISKYNPSWNIKHNSKVAIFDVM